MKITYIKDLELRQLRGEIRRTLWKKEMCGATEYIIVNESEKRTSIFIPCRGASLDATYIHGGLRITTGKGSAVDLLREYYGPDVEICGIYAETNLYLLDTGASLDVVSAKSHEEAASKAIEFPCAVYLLTEDKKFDRKIVRVS